MRKFLIVPALLLAGLLVFALSVPQAQAMAPNVSSVNETQLQQELANPGDVVLVFAYAEWCGPCHSYAPKFDAAAQASSSSVKFFKFDVDQNLDMARKLGLTATPTTYCMKRSADNSRVLYGEVTGGLSEDGVHQLVEICSSADVDEHLLEVNF